MTDVHRSVNIPTLLVLPIFANQISKKPIKRRKEPPVPLYMLMWEYGLVTSYIELDETVLVPEPTNIIVKFTKDVLEDKKLTSGDFYSLNDRLVSSEFVQEVWTQGDHVYYRMAMATNIVDDVIKIIDSKFTQVSELYKKLIKTPVKRLPDWEQNMGHFILVNNIPLGILKKAPHIKEMLEDDLGVKVESDLFRKFDNQFDIYWG